MSTGHLESETQLVGDIGGTYARFALYDARKKTLQSNEVLECREHADIAAAILAYVSRVRCAMPERVALAVACPVTSDLVELTNNSWRFSIEDTRARLDLAQLEVMNDFAALALSLPALEANDLEQQGGNLSTTSGVKALIGPGTGLGVSGLVRTRHGWVALDSEGGHVTFAPITARERAVVDVLAERYGHVSAERLCSGAGLSALYSAVCVLDRRPIEELAPSEVVARALAGSSSACIEAVELFCSVLGNVAGNLALTLGARGGLYVGGGIVPRLGPLFARSPFRERFESKGRFCSYLAPIPAFLIKHPYPALLGLARAFEEQA